jgi:hypothetical protein
MIQFQVTLDRPALAGVASTTLQSGRAPQIERSLPEFETESASVKAAVPEQNGGGGGRRAKPGKIRKHLKYLEFMERDENVGRRGEKSVKNSEKRLKFSANDCFIGKI